MSCTDLNQEVMMHKDSSPSNGHQGDKLIMSYHQ